MKIIKIVTADLSKCEDTDDFQKLDSARFVKQDIILKLIHKSKKISV